MKTTVTKNFNILFEINRYLTKSLGISFASSEFDNLFSKIIPRLQALNISSLQDYYNKLTTDKTEIMELVNYIVVNETTFFRHHTQFEILLNLIQEKFEKHISLNILSAGCSTGAEPYTVAMYLKEKLNNVLYDNVNIFGIDISSFNIDIAKKGVYSEYIIDRIQDEYYKNKYFTKIADFNYSIDNDIKKKVKFNVENLIRFNNSYNFDFIFCRNVLIYFSEEKKKMVLNNFKNNIRNPGYLFLAPTETLIGETKLFDRKKQDESTYYITKNTETEIVKFDFSVKNEKKKYDIEIHEDNILGNINITFEGTFNRSNLMDVYDIIKKKLIVLNVKKINFLFSKVTFINAEFLSKLGKFLTVELRLQEKIEIVSNKSQFLRMFEYHDLDGYYKLINNM